jgi:purine-binding chemotaxis protein CheW
MENAIANAAPAQDERDDLGDRFLLFHIGETLYGLPLTVVLEILHMQKITSVPKVAPYIKGVINMRGKAVPAVDLRLKLGLEERPYDTLTCMIVLEIGTSHVALIVDNVKEVVLLEPEKRSDPPSGSTYLGSVAQLGEEIAQLLDCRRLFEKDLPKTEA